MRRVPLSRIACVLLSALALLTSLSVGSAETSRTTSKKIRKSQPASPARAAPDTTATIAVPKVNDDRDEVLPTPFDLPPAPRARMRTCGERWQTIKLAGQAADQTWREFATKCLAQSESAKPPGH